LHASAEAKEEGKAMSKASNGENQKPQGGICRLCSCVMGVSERNLRELPGGGLAQDSCINERFHKKIVEPARKVIPDLPRISLLNSPESMIDIFLRSITKQPMELVGDIVKNVDQFAQDMLGKKVTPGGFITQ